VKKLFSVVLEPNIFRFLGKMKIFNDDILSLQMERWSDLFFINFCFAFCAALVTTLCLLSKMTYKKSISIMLFIAVYCWPLLFVMRGDKFFIFASVALVFHFVQAVLAIYFHERVLKNLLNRAISED
jgi:hypothetical protein